MKQCKICGSQQISGYIICGDCEKEIKLLKTKLKQAVEDLSTYKDVDSVFIFKTSNIAIKIAKGTLMWIISEHILAGNGVAHRTRKEIANEALQRFRILMGGT